MFIPFKNSNEWQLIRVEWRSDNKNSLATVANDMIPAKCMECDSSEALHSVANSFCYFFFFALLPGLYAVALCLSMVFLHVHDLDSRYGNKNTF